MLKWTGQNLLIVALFNRCLQKTACLSNAPHLLNFCIQSQCATLNNNVFVLPRLHDWLFTPNLRIIIIIPLEL